MKKQAKYALSLGLAGLAIMSAPLVNLGSESASAACALTWEKASGTAGWMVSACDGKATAGNFASKISDDNIITVDLNNYKGDAFVLRLSGTGLNLKKIVFNLTGENEITAENGIAFETGGLPIEFTGEGSLKVKALVPMMAWPYYVTEDYQEISTAEMLGDYVGYWKEHGGAVSEVTIRPTTAKVDPEEKPEDETDTEKPDDDAEKPEDCVTDGVITDEKDNPWTMEMLTIHIAAGIYIVLSLVTFILLGIRKITRKHQSKTNKKIIIEENGKKVGETEIEEDEEKQE